MASGESRLMSQLFFDRQERNWAPHTPMFSKRQRRREALHTAASAAKAAAAAPAAAPAGDGTEAPFDDTIITDAAKALGYILLTHPAAIETIVTSFMGRSMLDTQDAPLDTLKRTWEILLEHRPVLQVRIRETVNYLHEAAKRPICGLCVFHDRALVLDHARAAADMARLSSNSHEFHFECDQPLIQHAMTVAEQEITPAWLIEKRFSTILAILLATPNQTFAQRTHMRGVRIAVLSQFLKNGELARIYDPSIYIVAVLRFVLRHTAGLLASLESEEDKDKTSTTTPKRDSKEEEALSKSVSDLFEACNEFVQTNASLQEDAIADRPPASKVLEETAKDEADVHPLAYRPWMQLDESEEHMFGVPLEVLATSKKTLHWLHEAWSNPRFRPDMYQQQKKPGLLSPSETPADVEHPVIGLRRLVDDLWRAKSAWLMQDYDDFIMDWDKKYLIPLLESQGVDIPDDDDEDDDEEDEEDTAQSVLVDSMDIDSKL
jgi:hypothetical protein